MSADFFAHLRVGVFRAMSCYTAVVRAARAFAAVNRKVTFGSASKAAANHRDSVLSSDYSIFWLLISSSNSVRGFYCDTVRELGKSRSGNKFTRETRLPYWQVCGKHESGHP